MSTEIAQIFHREQRVQFPLQLLQHVQHKADTTVETRDFKH